MSKFSDFIRNATPEEKERVYEKVMESATKRQLMKHRWLEYAFFSEGFWVRAFGYGPFIRKDRMVLFSERYGYRKVWRLGRWSFEWLQPLWPR